MFTNNVGKIATANRRAKPMFFCNAMVFFMMVTDATLVPQSNRQPQHACQTGHESVYLHRGGKSNTFAPIGAAAARSGPGPARFGARERGKVFSDEWVNPAMRPSREMT
jgi:hypothetical protein